LADQRQRIESTAHLIAARDRALAGVATIRVDFEELRATPAAVIHRLAGELCLEVTEAQVQTAEGFALCRRMLARPEIPDDDRRRIANNRDVSVPAMIAAAASYPDAVAGSLVAGGRDAEVTVSVVAGPDPAITELTLNSFLHCCTDVSRVGRFLAVDAGLRAEDRTVLRERYKFVEFTDPEPTGASGAQLAAIRAQIKGRFWLHLGQGWRFFAPENYITRLTAVLDAEPQVFQAGINLADAVQLTGASAPEHAVRGAGDTGRYVLTDVVASGPACSIPHYRAGGFAISDPDPIGELARRAAAAGLRTASLDEVLCIPYP
jgi:hypothetical protein